MGQQAVLPFSLSGTWTDPPTGLQGSEYLYKDGKRYRFVKNVSGGTLSGRRNLEWVTRASYTVQYATGRYANVCGITPDELAVDTITVANNDWFLMQIDGRAELTRGDAGGNVVIGEYVANATDTDNGKCEGITLRRDEQLISAGQFKTEAGLTLTAATNPSIAQAGGKELRATWAAADATVANIGEVSVPKDFDVDADDISLIFLVTKAGTTDARTLLTELYVTPAGGGAPGADLAIAAVALGAALITNPTEKEVDLTGKSLVPGDKISVLASLTQLGTDAGTIVSVFLRYKSREVPGHAFAVALDVAAANDTVFTARLLHDQLINS